MTTKTVNRILTGLCVAEAAFLGILCLSLANICPPPVDASSIPAFSEPLDKTVWPAKKEPFTANGIYLERETLFMAFQPKDVDLVCLGDSITQKFEWQDALPNWQVANRGIGSDTTAGITARLDSIQKLNPAVISLMAGINDLTSSNPEDASVSYALLLDALTVELPNTTVIVSGLLPVAEAHPINNQNVRTLNTALKELCQERSLVFLDLYEVFADEDGNLLPEYALDNVHLSAEGYRVWLSYLVPALAEVLAS